MDRQTTNAARVIAELKKKGTRRTLRSCRKDSDKQEPVGKREWYIRTKQQIRKKKTLIRCVHFLVIHSVKKKKEK